jgi:TonB-linked SusC/RagA family outer membrane protein
LVFAGFLVFLTIFNPATIRAENGRGGITIRHDNVPIQKVFQSIEKQSGYRFFYNETLLQGAVKVTLNLQNVSLQEALDACFRNQPLSYAIVDKTIIVKRRPGQQSLAPVPTAVSFTKPNKGKLIAVRGKVTSNNIPVAGASIMIKGTDNGVSTDKDGIFTISEVEEDAILVVSSISHDAREIKINGQAFISVDLSRKSDDLDEAVVVAYNTTTKRMNTGAVAVVKGEDIQSLTTRSIDRALQGMVPGLQITSGSGLPGGGVANITVRGIATGGDGIARSPLYVLDGTIITQDNFNGGTTYTGSPNYAQPTNPLSQINPNDVESISVLKDAAAIALYGSQASNGVILITTKKGKTGKLLANFRHQTDISTSIEKSNRDVLNPDQYMELLYESYRNATPGITDSAITKDLRSKFPTRSDGSFYPAPDWFHELYNNNAVAVSNDLSFSGGSNKTTFYLGLGNLTQKGVLKNTGFNRTSIRYNLGIRPVSWFNLGVNSSFTYTRQKYEGGSFEAMTSPNGFPYYVSPLLPVRLENGNYQYFFANGAGGNTIPNPVARMEYDEHSANGYHGVGNAFAEVNFLKHFTLRSNVGADLLYSKTRDKNDKRVDQFSSSTGGGSLYEIDEIRTILVLTNMLRYQQSFGGIHSINFLISQEAQTTKSNFLRAAGTGFNSGFSNNEISSATNKTALGYNSKATFLSYFAQANYDLKKRYLLSLGSRLDGSSRFGANVPLNKFWSVGAGWIVSEESFLKRSSTWINYLKIRGSLGVAGNTIAIPSNTRSDRVQGISSTNKPATIGSMVVLISGNPDVKSESTFNTDLGLEARFLNDRVQFTGDIYRRKTYDMVTSVPTPLISGLSSVYSNLGDMENKGIELTLSVDVIRNRNFKWNINGNWSTNKNKLVKANDLESSSLKLVNRVGENYNSFYLVRWAGVDPADGSPQWLDINGNITKTYSTNDRVIVGKPQPDGFGALNTGFQFKNIDLKFFFYYSYGYKVYNSWLEGMLNDGRSQPYQNQSVQALDRWQKPGDVAANPKRVLNNAGKGNSQSTRYLADGDYVRLKNVMLSYMFKESFIKRLHLSNLRAFVQASNIALWTKSKAIDPDNTGYLGDNGAAYPQQKSISIGLNIDL